MFFAQGVQKHIKVQSTIQTPLPPCLRSRRLQVAIFEDEAFRLQHFTTPAGPPLPGWLLLRVQGHVHESARAHEYCRYSIMPCYEVGLHHRGSVGSGQC